MTKKKRKYTKPVFCKGSKFEATNQYHWLEGRPWLDGKCPLCDHWGSVSITTVSRHVANHIEKHVTG